MKLRLVLLLGVTFIVTLMVDNASSAKILVAAFFSANSNKITYMNLVEELGKRNHTVTVLTPLKPFKELKNVKEIYTLDLEKIFEKNKFNAFDSKEKGQAAGLDPITVTKMIIESCSLSLELPQVKALLNEKFDLVIFPPLFNDCVLALIYRLKAPFVLFAPTANPPWINHKVGGYYVNSITPNFLTGFQTNMTFYERLISFGADLIIEGFYALYYEPLIEKVYREKLGQDIPSINEIFKNASLVLANTHFSIGGLLTTNPDVIDVGGIHSRPAKEVPKDIDDFIKKGDGFILFSMGSAIKGSMMPESKRKMILKVFSKLEQQVLWKWESETMEDLPINVKLSKWLPQQDLLGRKDIKMFITHCGGGSTEEAIYHGVPLIGIPMMADQPRNADLAEQHGFIVRLDWNEMTEENFSGAIQEILNNSKYKDNVEKISKLFKDRPMDPLEVGVYWIEYIIRHKGAEHLRSVGRKLNTFQYHSYDVIVTYLGIIGGIVYVGFVMLRFLCRKIFCRSKKSDMKEKKNN